VLFHSLKVRLKDLVHANHIVSNFSCYKIGVMHSLLSVRVTMRAITFFSSCKWFVGERGILFNKISNRELKEGIYNVPFSGNDLNNGIYICTLDINNKIRLTKKMIKQ